MHQLINLFFLFFFLLLLLFFKQVCNGARFSLDEEQECVRARARACVCNTLFVHETNDINPFWCLMLFMYQADEVKLMAIPVSFQGLMLLLCRRNEAIPSRGYMIVFQANDAVTLLDLI